MSDLLECLLQIKGLRETMERLSSLLNTVDESRWTQRAPGGGPSAGELLDLLAEIESVHAEWLRLMLTTSRPALTALDQRGLIERARRRGRGVRDGLDAFLVARRGNLELLDRCSAADLSRTAAHPARREITVADLVAVMLARDAERVGEIRRILSVASSG